ncbi:UPF0104 family protein [Castellaniella ginsengisoli]|uniref:UPF0104 family protein n=1 Tax=Castellaniella ginsengisoli TaxID=546114 RepID=A0AB39CHP5_9BURK
MTPRIAFLWRRLRETWPRIARFLALTISLAVIAMLVRLGSQIDWREVFLAVRGIAGTTLALAGVLAFSGYAAYAGIDYLARRFLHHEQTVWKTLAIAAASYAFNVNLGVLLGSVGVRLRLYRMLGLRHTSTAGVVLFGSVTNWLGYCWMGAIFFFGAVPGTLASWGIGPAATRTAGAVLVLVACTYVFLCATAARRAWSFRGHHLAFPSVWMAMAQSGLAIASWNIVALVIYLLLERQVPYPEVLGITLLSSIAALLTHIPGGLGVTEVVFVDALRGQMNAHDVLAAILMYRVLYQWIPLCIALPGYVAVEIKIRRNRCGQDGQHAQKNGQAQ